MDNLNIQINNNSYFTKENNFTLCEKIFTFKNIGKRKIQEDDIFICDIIDIDKTLFNVLFIFDGHGATNKITPLPEYIIKKNILFNELKKYFEIKKVTTINIANFFLNFDIFLENKINKQIGTCVSAIFISLDFIYIVSLGDTVIKIFDLDHKLIFQTNIHNFNNINEVTRYKELKQDMFIKNNRYKGLLMSRTIGDFDCKIIGEQCLIPIPDIKKFYNNKNFIFLLKTDGINISSKTLLDKYHDETIDNFLKTKKFIDNASLIIFKNVFMTKDSNEVLNSKKEDLDNNYIFLDFLKYIYD